MKQFELCFCKVLKLLGFDSCALVKYGALTIRSPHLATKAHLGLVFTRDASTSEGISTSTAALSHCQNNLDARISTSTRMKTFPFSCAGAYACACLRCVKTEHMESFYVLQMKNTSSRFLLILLAN